MSTWADLAECFGGGQMTGGINVVFGGAKLPKEVDYFHATS